MDIELQELLQVKYEQAISLAEVDGHSEADAHKAMLCLAVAGLKKLDANMDTDAAIQRAIASVG